MTISDRTLTGDQTVNLTRPGQAHFADPSIGARCKDCTHLTAHKTKHFCDKAAQMTGRQMHAVPPMAIACKYFQRRT